MYCMSHWIRCAISPGLSRSVKKKPPWKVGTSKAAGAIGLIKSGCEFNFAPDIGLNRKPPRMFNRQFIRRSEIKVVRFISRSHEHGDSQSLFVLSGCSC